MELKDDSSNLYNLMESSSNQNNVKDFKKELTVWLNHGFYLESQ